MDGSNTAFEGVATRHGGTKARGKNSTSGRGVVVFADSHSEARLDRDARPEQRASQTGAAEQTAQDRKSVV